MVCNSWTFHAPPQPCALPRVRSQVLEALRKKMARFQPLTDDELEFMENAQQAKWNKEKAIAEAEEEAAARRAGDKKIRRESLSKQREAALFAGGAEMEDEVMEISKGRGGGAMARSNKFSNKQIGDAITQAILHN